MASSIVHTNFLSLAEKVFEKLGHLNNQGAVSALRSILDKAEPLIKQADIAVPNFASHGPDHLITLVQFTYHLAEAGKFTRDSIFRDPELGKDALVLLFSSFILHDIGMGIIPANSTDDFDDALRNKKYRPKHDLRSLEFIEQDLIKGYKDLAGWRSFWENDRSKHFPDRPAEFALLITARICASHGDTHAVWMRPEHFCSYAFVSSSEVANFEESCAAGWDEVKRLLIAVSAVLNLSDLCNIDRNRFKEFYGKLHELTMPDLGSEKITHFWHWAAHAVVEIGVETSSPYLNARIHFPNPTDDPFGKKLAMLQLCRQGPLYFLLHYGNNPLLISALTQYAGIAYEGTRVSDHRRDLDRWDQIYIRAEADNPRLTWPQRELNLTRYAGGRPGLKYFNIVLSPSSAEWFSDSLYNYQALCLDDNTSRQCKRLINLRKSGLAIENFYIKPVPAPNERRALLISPSWATKNQNLGMLDLIFGATQVARSVFTEHIKPAHVSDFSITLIDKLSGRYASIKKGIFTAFAPYTCIVLILPDEDEFDLSNLSTILVPEHIWLFIVGTQKVRSLWKGSVLNIAQDAAQLKWWRENFHLTIAPGNTGPIDKSKINWTPSSDASPAEILNEFLLRVGDQSDLIQETVALADSADDIDYWKYILLLVSRCLCFDEFGHRLSLKRVKEGFSRLRADLYNLDTTEEFFDRLLAKASPELTRETGNPELLRFGGMEIIDKLLEKDCSHTSRTRFRTEITRVLLWFIHTECPTNPLLWRLFSWHPLFPPGSAIWKTIQGNAYTLKDKADYIKLLWSYCRAAGKSSAKDVFGYLLEMENATEGLPTSEDKLLIFQAFYNLIGILVDNKIIINDPKAMEASRSDLFALALFEYLSAKGKWSDPQFKEAAAFAQDRALALLDRQPPAQNYHAIILYDIMRKFSPRIDNALVVSSLAAFGTPQGWSAFWDYFQAETPVDFPVQKDPCAGRMWVQWRRNYGLVNNTLSVREAIPQAKIDRVEQALKLLGEAPSAS